jgi:hypothetical protein
MLPLRVWTTDLCPCVLDQGAALELPMVNWPLSLVPCLLFLSEAVIVYLMAVPAAVPAGTVN